MVETVVEGGGPMWDQPLSANDGVALSGAHLLQSFAFAEGDRRSLIVLNLSRTVSLPVTFAGPNAPRGVVVETVLTSAQIEDSNELAAVVAPRTVAVARFDAGAVHPLPPFSVTTYTWKVR